MQPKTQINVRQFKRVLILYNRYSGKQLFASMMSRINEVYKLLKQELAAEINLVDVKLFDLPYAVLLSGIRIPGTTGLLLTTTKNASGTS